MQIFLIVFCPYNILEEIDCYKELPPKEHLTKHKAMCNPYYYLENRNFTIYTETLLVYMDEIERIALTTANVEWYNLSFFL